MNSSGIRRSDSCKDFWKEEPALKSPSPSNPHPKTKIHFHAHPIPSQSTIITQRRGTVPPSALHSKQAPFFIEASSLSLCKYELHVRHSLCRVWGKFLFSSDTWERFKGSRRKIWMENHRIRNIVFFITSFHKATVVHLLPTHWLWWVLFFLFCLSFPGWHFFCKISCIFHV